MFRNIFSQKSIFQSSKKADTDFRITVQGVTLHVNRFNLEYNSPVFRRMFKENEKDINPKEEFSINNFKVVQVDEFLRFFYPELRARLNGKCAKN